MPLNQVTYHNKTGQPVTFRLDHNGTGGPQPITRLVNPGPPVTDPIDPAWGIFEVLPTSDIKGVALPNPLVLAGPVSDPGMVTATARADSTIHGQLTTVGGGNAGAEYLPKAHAEPAAPTTTGPDAEEPPQPSA